MARTLLTELVLFLLPFVAYGLYLMATRKRALDADSWPLSRVAWLTIAAMVLAIGGFLVLVGVTGAPGDWVYIPAHIDENGNFVPGKLVPRPK